MKTQTFSRLFFALTLMLGLLAVYGNATPCLISGDQLSGAGIGCSCSTCDQMLCPSQPGQTCMFSSGVCVNGGVGDICFFVENSDCIGPAACVPRLDEDCPVI